MLGDEIKRAQARGDPDTGETYYRHWLTALERIVAEKGVTDPAALARYRDAWDRAPTARRTARRSCSSPRISSRRRLQEGTCHGVRAFGEGPGTAGAR